ncbi:polyprenyl synthetase family protein [Nevskia ramosa]|uniref:polyprenyl synthetase family protein n=1 Tax=Nevskia ramosa TaxID=64002 RepID=UPI002354CB6E|nr:polyprenyl synthetase family protein [Nevskia ramosa]
MANVTRIEQALISALAPGEAAGCPPKLAAALRYAVFPGGARIRPRLCLAVAMANGDPDPAATDAAAAAIELLHCASLVHDDLPCFDNAELRRGKPSVHRAYGERLAVLAGDGLIVVAFQSLAAALAHDAQRLAALVPIISRAISAPTGIVAGQAWECEPLASLSDYQQAKTGALFAGATMAGAAAAGVADPTLWRALGERLGEAFQVADDILDVAGNAEKIGKPTGQDATLGRPNAVRELGHAGALARLESLVDGAIAAIPDCIGAHALRLAMRLEMQNLLPVELRHAA